MSKALEDIFKKLELDKDGCLHKCGEKLPDYPSRIKISLQSIKYDAIYSVNNTPMILFKEYNSFKDIDAKIYNLHKDVWNLGEVPIIFILLPNEIRIYNGFIFSKDKEKSKIWKKLSLEDNKLQEFSLMNIISGNFWKKYGNDFNKKTRVQDYLLENLKDARDILHKNQLSFPIIHNIIGRLIFSRYLIDRNALSQNFFRKKYGKSFEEIIQEKDNLYDYFRYLKEKFNGDMFPLVENEEDIIQETHLNVLYRLFKGHKISTGQSVLFDIYDFSIIPIELISNIYETFLDRENNNSNKSYYTPLFLVDYILDQTLDKIIAKKSLNNSKILDPACGSGVFLVESLRRLIEKEESIKKNNLTNNELNDIVLNNIFGIDKDEDAINISIFSIYLTLLDYQEPKSIEKFKFPELKNKNLFVSDFFDLENSFNNTIKDIDFIIGNPPWTSCEGLHLDYCKRNNIPISDKQIAQSFLIRVKDFAKDESRIALIITSKILYNLNAGKFREYLLNNFVINKVLEFSAVRRKIFKNAIGPGAILFYKLKKDENIKENFVEHISLKPNRFFDLFRTIVIEKYDIKQIQQEYFIKFDWLWKVILYGSVLDFYFIKRLKEYSTIDDIINEKKLIKGVGIQVNGPGKLQDAPHLIGKKFLDAKKGMLQRYYVNTEDATIWNIMKLRRSPNPKLFQAPYILIKKMLNSDFKLVAAFSDEDMVFKDTITAIKGKNNDKGLLKNILGLLNSNLFTYYIFSTGSSTGIEREQVHNNEKFSFPFILDEKINFKVDQIQDSYKSRDSLFGLDKKLEKDLDEHISNIFDLNHMERDLVSYALNVSIPIFNNDSNPFNPPTKAQLRDYTQIFMNYFGNKFNGPNKFFSVEIHQSEFFIAMIFNVISKKPKEPITFCEDKNVHDLIKRLGLLSLEKRKDLYIQRDIKGFEETSFYVIKPNEFKNWHRAIARLDLNEFMSALLTNNIENPKEAT